MQKLPWKGGSLCDSPYSLPENKVGWLTESQDAFGSDIPAFQKKFADPKLILTSGSGISLGNVSTNALLHFSGAILQCLSITSA